MKTKNILMSLLLVMGAIAAKASGYPPELALVSQPVMVYNSNSITVYYDVENIGDHTYRGYVSLYLDPDYGYSYAEKYVRVYPGRIKRIAIDIPLRRIDRRTVFTIMPYYELGDYLYSFTTFEYFEPIRFCWDGPRDYRWIVVNVPPRPRHYHRPGTYRYYYDGYRPPMPPPGHGPGTPPPPMDPMHHTYGYHHNNGGYPATHNDWTPAPEPAPNHNDVAPNATVRPSDSAGSMSGGSHNNGNNTPAPTPNNNGSNSGRVNPNDNHNDSGRVTPNNNSPRPSSNNNSGRVNNNSNNPRPSGSNNNSGRVNNNNNNPRPSGSNNNSGRVNNNSNNPRPSGSNNNSSRVNNSNNTLRPSSSNNNSSRVNSNNSNRSGSGSGRR